MPETFSFEESQDVSSYFNFNTSSFMVLDDVADNFSHLKFQSFENDHLSAAKTVDDEHWPSVPRPIAALDSDDEKLPSISRDGFSSMPIPMIRALSVPSIEDSSSPLSRSAPDAFSFAVPKPSKNFNIASPSSRSAQDKVVDLTIPSFRREASFVGQARGFDLFSPDDWEDDKLPNVTEGELGLDFQYEPQASSQPGVGSNAAGLNFDDFRVGVTQSNPLGSIPLNGQAPQSPSTSASSFRSFRNESTSSPIDFRSFRAVVKAEPGTVKTEPSGVVVKKEVEADPLAKCFRFHEQQITSVVKSEPQQQIAHEKVEEDSTWGYEEDEEEEIVSKPQQEASHTHKSIVISAFPSSPLSAPSSPPPLIGSDHDEEDSKITIGSYTRAERRQKIARYRAKRANRNFNRKIMYRCRKSFADNRPRVGGRFVSMKNKPTKKVPVKVETQKRKSGTKATKSKS